MSSAPGFSEALHKASGKALKGGIAGAGAQAINVSVLMGMHTVMTYQYCHGGQFSDVFRKLWAEGGLIRFYRGLLPSLIQVPIGRFVDVVANDLALTTLKDTGLPTAAKIMCASALSASFRVVIMPVDAWKTTKQVEGKEGLRRLIEKARRHPTALWHGGACMATAAMVGHYSWFYTHHQLCEAVPEFDFVHGKHARHALIGSASSAVSDCFCNSLKVLKTQRQTSMVTVGYAEAAKQIMEREGLSGLLGRGLKTRLLASSLQGALFSVGWRALSELMDGKGGRQH